MKNFGLLLTTVSLLSLAGLSSLVPQRLESASPLLAAGKDKKDKKGDKKDKKDDKRGKKGEESEEELFPGSFDPLA